MRTPELAARVTVREVAAGSGFAVQVSVRVLRGTWEFGPAAVRMRSADGAESTPVLERASRGARTLHAGVAQSWQIPFGRAAGAGAHLLLSTPAGTALAWITG
ncbi:hypothetical protein [Actinoplanes ianthinogenes]|uniref:hypothetical protein n=1 Tax=Actinoplanes ianthinogenes TaxID=122358 RepID=UPI001670FDDE|nr:hypothetical protein [Actinoplanes ianthinogenes]